MNSMRIIGGSNPAITSVNRITYVVDTDEVVAYVNKSTLLGRYPNLYYAYEAVRGAMMRCGCRDPYMISKIPVNLVSKSNLLATVTTQFIPTVENSVDLPTTYGTWILRVSNPDITTVYTPIVTLPPSIYLMYKSFPGPITAPTSVGAAVAAGFIPINSGDPIIFPASAPDFRVRFALYINYGLTAAPPSSVFTLRNVASETQNITTTTLNYNLIG